VRSLMFPDAFLSNSGRSPKSLRKILRSLLN
jgi:hypothetical protein